MFVVNEQLAELRKKHGSRFIDGLVMLAQGWDRSRGIWIEDATFDAALLDPQTTKEAAHPLWTHQGVIATQHPGAASFVVTPRSADSWAVNGPRMWAELHARARQYAGDADAERDWLVKFTKRIGCGHCQQDWEALQIATPPDLSCADAYYAWTIAAHNSVNRKLGKPEWTPPTARTPPELWVGGYPSNYGGADTELMHQIYLWRDMGCEVNLVPFGTPSEEMRRVCDALGCKTHQYRRDIFKGRVVVSFCSGEFLKRLDEIYEGGAPLAVVWFNCMTWLFPAEKEAHRKGQITHFGYQTHYQKQKLMAELEKIAPVVSIDYVPYYSVERNAQGIQFEYRRPAEYFGVGRVSRDDADKFSPDTWSIFAAVKSPLPLKAFVLGYGQRARAKCGDPPAGLDYCTWEPGGLPVKSLYERIHALVHKTGGSRENYPRVLLECWNAGVVPIFEAAWGLPEIITDGQDGFLCSSSEEMSARASQLAADEPMRKRMVEAGYAKLLSAAGSKQKCWAAWERFLKTIHHLGS